METENRHQAQNTQKSFLGFPNVVKRFIPKHSTLKSTHTSLVENKNSMNSDACLSCFDKSIYRA